MTEDNFLNASSKVGDEAALAYFESVRQLNEQVQSLTKENQGLRKELAKSSKWVSLLNFISVNPEFVLLTSFFVGLPLLLGVGVTANNLIDKIPSSCPQPPAQVQPEQK